MQTKDKQETILLIQTCNNCKHGLLCIGRKLGNKTCGNWAVNKGR